MKKILITVIGTLCTAAIYVGINTYTNNSQTYLLTQNVEALTRGENVSGTVNCEGDGSLYCPLTNTSKYSLIIYSQN